MASILVSGNDALHANSDKHLTASWNESIVAEKNFSNMVAKKGTRFVFINLTDIIFVLSCWQG